MTNTINFGVLYRSHDTGRHGYTEVQARDAQGAVGAMRRVVGTRRNVVIKVTPVQK